MYCYPPPGRQFAGEGDEAESVQNPLAVYLEVFGPGFADALRDKVVLDIGCGGGYQVVAAAELGARVCIGTEAREVFGNAQRLARQRGLANRVQFTLEPMENMPAGSIDVALSQNSFEHFDDPAGILSGAMHALRPGGRFFITFAPPWLNPFGVHMFFMIKYPWAHFLFSERTIMTVRKLYRNDGADYFREAEGGLNKMTIRKFLTLVGQSGFNVVEFAPTPIRFTPPFLSRVPGLREFVTSRVSAILERP